MADYTDSKFANGDLYPQNATDSSWGRLEPLVTPQQLRMRKLFGIPLRSGWGNMAAVVTDEMLQDVIRRMVDKLEAEARLIIMPTKFFDRFPFDRQEFNSFGYLQLPNRPVSSIDKLAIQDTNRNDIFTMPPAWISIGALTRGRINIIPLSPAQTSATFSALTGTGASFGSTTLAVLSMPSNIPSYWTCEYTAGFPDGKIPSIVNELLATMAALEVLSLLAATFARSGPHSLGIDGLSQSVSNPGADLFKVRMEELQKEKDLALKKVRGIFGRNFVVGTL